MLPPLHVARQLVHRVEASPLHQAFCQAQRHRCVVRPLAGLQTEWSAANDVLHRHKRPRRLELDRGSQRIAYSQPDERPPHSIGQIARWLDWFVAYGNLWQLSSGLPRANECHLRARLRGRIHCQMRIVLAPLRDQSERLLGRQPLFHHPATGHRACPAVTTPAMHVGQLPRIHRGMQNLENLAHHLAGWCVVVPDRKAMKLHLHPLVSRNGFNLGFIVRKRGPILAEFTGLLQVYEHPHPHGDEFFAYPPGLPWFGGARIASSDDFSGLNPPCFLDG